jgi:2,4-dienoyl-CoA reductase-like NADH-dependent reductase (Old Yellow Enzyme family)
MPTVYRLLICAAVLACSLLSGCDMIGAALGIESPEKVAAARDADGRAIGGACRHAGRAIEDCFSLNRKADRAAVFAGWRDMNDYMRENKIESVAPQLANAGVKAAAEVEDSKPAAPAEKAATKSEGSKPRSREGAKPHDS